MAPMTRAQQREYNAKQRRLQKDRERLQREQRRAQRSLQALEHALVDLDLPSTLVEEVQWRLQAQVKLLGKIFGLMFPGLFGCCTTYELSRVRGWDKHLAGKILGALPKQNWVRQLQHRGQDLLATLWRHVEDKSPATRSRWQWTWVGDDSLFKKYGHRLGLVGTWWSGQEHRVRLGIDGLLLVVADRWFGDSKLMAHVGFHQHGTVLVEGKSTYVFQLLDGRRVTGRELLSRVDWPWRDSPQDPRVRYVRLTATSHTYGPVPVVIVAEPGQERYYLLCRVTPLTAPRLIRAWKRRSWIEHHFRLLKHLLATEACQVHGEDADSGHLVLRLLAGLVLLYTARILYKGCVTMEELVFSLKHHWRFLNSKDLELHGLSWDLSLEAA